MMDPAALFRRLGRDWSGARADDPIIRARSIGSGWLMGRINAAVRQRAGP
jgi:hypothetical protein